MLPYLPAHKLNLRSEEIRWLICELWSDQAVGILGGEPKCCKSFLALDIAVAVASGTPCLRHFQVAKTGRVLFYAAEDSLSVVRQRLEGICTAAGASLDKLDIQVITSSTLLLDQPNNRQMLQKTVENLKPTMLILDPFIRLHNKDENAASEVSPLLAYLRLLQRNFQLSVLVVHHAKKNGGQLRPGQALRGSSEFHGWGDSNLYLQRKANQLTLSIEHRAEKSTMGIPLHLNTDGPAIALSVLPDALASTSSVNKPSAKERIQTALAKLTSPVPLADLRHLCQMRMSTLCDALADMKTSGHIIQNEMGYQLPSRKS